MDRLRRRVMMQPESDIDADTVAAAARVAGIAVADGDLDLLTRTMRRYADVVAPLRAADLDDFVPAASTDPRTGW